MKVIGLIASLGLGAALGTSACSTGTLEPSSLLESSSSSVEEPLAAAACTHAICAAGGALKSSCDPCATKVCRSDSYCCRTAWDDQCVGEVASICQQSCAPDAGPPVCSHAVCTTGGKLSAACDPCVATVCASDPYCCQTSWNAQCVSEAKSQCTNACGAPPPVDAGETDAAPADAGAVDAAPADAGAVDAGGTGIGPNGGTLGQLSFGIVGDTRPASIDDTAGYPTDVITQIFGDVAARADAPPFVVSTGDYNFSSTTGGEAANQYALYMKARAQYAGAWFPAMGNHECTGYTNSNCGAGTADGITENYTGFLSQLLGPIQKSDPYYVIHVNANDGSWTSKFVFVAANAWTSAQASWLSSVLSQSTTYTFVVRHEAASVTSAPGVSPSQSIMAAHPYTLAVVGHSHTYSHSGRELLVGNGGAPLTGSVNYGYAMARRRSDGAIVVDMYDYQTNVADSSFHFAVGADGSPASP